MIISDCILYMEKVVKKNVRVKPKRSPFAMWDWFLNRPWSSGVILMACVVAAMLLANLPATMELYRAALNTDLAITVMSPIDAETGRRLIEWSFPQGMTVEKFVNDVLMVVFFFTVGLEIKREMVSGELSSAKKAMLPVMAAMGGMVVPALIYAFINGGTAAQSGWGIPTATDIAFAVAILSMFGRRVPTSLKAFLTALAIADDLGAILIVAIFYGGSINLDMLSIAMLIIALVLIMNRMRVNSMMCYLIPAIAVWFLFYYSGVHSTMSGVVMALAIPMDSIPTGKDMASRLHRSLEPWVNYAIMPIFALANAGVVIPDLSEANPFCYSSELGSVGLGVILGLVLGKPLGITLASALAIRMKVGEMPSGATWSRLAAVACLGGIGFTMSIFVDTLSFGEQSIAIATELRNMGKMAVLCASVCAAVLGCVCIMISCNKKQNI